MALQDITDPAAVEKAVEEYDQLGQEAFLAKYGFREARRLLLEVDGAHYDSKAILGAAHGYQFPDAGPLAWDAFSGGENTTGKKLRELGFIVIPRSDVSASENGDDSLPLTFQRVLELQTSWKSQNTPAMAERGELIRNTGPKELRAHLLNGSPLGPRTAVEGRDGTGLKTRVPWVRVYLREASPRATEGWYVVYLFAADGSAVYLSLNQGTTTFADGDFKAKPIAEIAGRVSKARAVLGAELEGDGWLTDIELRDSGELGRGYERGNVAALKYAVGAIPSAEQLFSDLDVALSLLKQLYDLSGDEAGPGETPRKPAAEAMAVFDVTLVRKAADDRGVIVRDGVLAAVVAALRSGKHVVLTGPPGTAKTTLAEAVTSAARRAGLCAGALTTTATSDWTTYETIGGLRPMSDGTLEFASGQFLKAIDRNEWLLIDELNRSNFDRAFGQLFTVLSGQSVELPYVHAADGLPIILSPDGPPREGEAMAHVIKVPATWRVVATMNVFDKSLLFEMSFALMRRFAFIEIPAPADSVYLELIARELDGADGDVRAAVQEAAGILLSLRSVKEIGPALFIDIARFSRELVELGSISPEDLLLQCFYSYLLPQFEGIADHEAVLLAGRLHPNLSDEGRQRLRSMLTAVLGVTLPRSLAPGGAVLEDDDE